MFGATEVSQKAQIPSQTLGLLGLPSVVCPVSATNTAKSPFFGILDDVGNFPQNKAHRQQMVTVEKKKANHLSLVVTWEDLPFEPGL